MLARRIVGFTHKFGEPERWDETKYGHCSPLAVRVSTLEGAQICETAWEPTPAELKMLNSGASVILRVMGNQPPVSLFVEQNLEADQVPSPDASRDSPG